MSGKNTLCQPVYHRQTRVAAYLQHVRNLLLTLHHELHQVLDIHAAVGAFLQLQLVVRIFRQQVSNLLVVNLQVASTHKELLCAACEDGYDGEVSSQLGGSMRHEY